MKYIAGQYCRTNRVGKVMVIPSCVSCSCPPCVSPYPPCGVSCPSCPSCPCDDASLSSLSSPYPPCSSSPYLPCDASSPSPPCDDASSPYASSLHHKCSSQSTAVSMDLHFSPTFPSIRLHGIASITWLFLALIPKRRPLHAANNSASTHYGITLHIPVYIFCVVLPDSSESESESLVGVRLPTFFAALS